MPAVPGQGPTILDEALSSVIAAILLVAICIALAGVIAVWVQGFGGLGNPPPPAADANVLSCNVGKDAVTARLVTGGPLPTADLAAVLVNRSSSVAEGRSDPLQEGPRMWETQTRLTIAEPGEDPPTWDDPLSSPGGLAPEERYKITWVHKPSQSAFSVDRFTCGPADPPDPSLSLSSCRAHKDEFTVRLTSDEALTGDDWRATLVNRSDDTTEGVSNPLGVSLWRPGQAQTFHDGTRNGPIQWDGGLNRGLASGGSYDLSLHHLPSSTTRERLTFTC